MDKQRQKQAFAEKLLNNMTWAEKILWSRLRHRRIGYSFQRQAIVLGFIVDFYCPTAKVIVEVDGDIHLWPEKQKRDEEKDTAFHKFGFDCLRFTNEEVREGMSAVLIRILSHCFEHAPAKLKTNSWETSRDRGLEPLEFRALRDWMDDKRQQIHELNFSRRYWEKHSLSVQSRRKG